MEGQKDSWNCVVRGFELRGAMTTTRLGGLVIRTVDSCLEDIYVVG